MVGYGIRIQFTNAGAQPKNQPIIFLLLIKKQQYFRD